MGLAATRNGKSRGCRPLSLEKGVESNLAQEQSMTAIPFCKTMSLSSYEMLFCPRGERTMPGNLWERVISLTNPSRQSFLPEHFLGSHWPRSCSSVAIAAHMSHKQWFALSDDQAWRWGGGTLGEATWSHIMIGTHRNTSSFLPHRKTSIQNESIVVLPPTPTHPVPTGN